MKLYGSRDKVRRLVKFNKFDNSKAYFILLNEVPHIIQCRLNR